MDEHTGHDAASAEGASETTAVRVPGTAIVAAASITTVTAESHERLWRKEPSAVRQLLEHTLDAVDDLADAIAHGLGLRTR